MSKSAGISPELHAYSAEISVREHPVLTELRNRTAALPQANMQIAPDQGAFMQFLVQAMGARRCLEVGVFTGYSTLAVALALPKDGCIVACDISEEWTAIGRDHWLRAGVDAKIDLRLAPAIETLESLLQDGQSETFDFAFIDADKTAYEDYYEKCLQLIRPGGVIAVDNVLWGGSVLSLEDQRPDTVAIRTFNDRRRTDERVSLTLVPIADGLTLAWKRP